MMTTTTYTKLSIPQKIIFVKTKMKQISQDFYRHKQISKKDYYIHLDELNMTLKYLQNVEKTNLKDKYVINISNDNY